MKRFSILFFVCILSLASCYKPDVPGSGSNNNSNGGSNGSNTAGTISALNCGGTSFSNGFMENVNANNVKMRIPYTGGNGGKYSTQIVSSTGITGLTAKLDSGNLAVGDGKLSFNVTGIPSGSGLAYFAINLLGNSCQVIVSVNPYSTIVNLNCLNAKVPSLASGKAANDTLFIPYTGGDGSAYTQKVYQSTGITGLTATLPAGNFANGSGTFAFIITGTPASIGLADFNNISFGGTTCSFGVPINVDYGFSAYVNGKFYSAYVAPFLRPNPGGSSYMTFEATVSSLEFFQIKIPESTPNNTNMTCDENTTSSVTFQEGTTPWSTSLSGGSGDLFIEINDKVNRRLKGTFSGSFGNGISPNKTVTQGKFDFIY